MWRRARTALVVIPATIALGSLLPVPPALAEVRISGSPNRVQMEARDASVKEALAALHDSFGLKYRGGPALERRVNARYEGSLRRVVRDLLEGYDFILVTERGTLEAVVVGAATTGGEPVATAPPIATVTPGVRRRPD